MFGPLSVPLLAGFGVVALLASIFWIWMLVDAATHEKNSTDKLVWVLIILFTHLIGAVIYFILRRAHRTPITA